VVAEMNYKNLTLKKFLSNKIESQENQELAEIENKLQNINQQTDDLLEECLVLKKSEKRNLIKLSQLLRHELSVISGHKDSRATIILFQNEFPKLFDIIAGKFELFFKEWTKAVKDKANLKENKYDLFSLYIEQTQNNIDANVELKNTLLSFEKSQKNQLNTYERLIFHIPTNNFLQIPRLVLASLKSNKKKFEELLLKKEKDAKKGLKFKHQLSNFNKDKYENIWKKYEQMKITNPKVSLRNAVYSVDGYQDEKEFKKYYSAFYKFCKTDHKINSLQEFVNFISTYRQ
jgi:hypothetical protein